MSRLKGCIKLLVFLICLGVSLLLILNLPVTSKQGINYEARTIRIPLYIKIIEFLDRDYHYRELVKRVCRVYATDAEKVMALFKWTCGNIRTDIPQDWPLIDDHVWSIVVRGYGTRDQLSHLFTTLCNYAGQDAFYTWIYTANRRQRIALSFVKIAGRWCIFDPYHGAYFMNANGKLADIEEVKFDSNWFIKGLHAKPDIDYAAYTDNFPSVQGSRKIGRGKTQSPVNRLMFEIKKLNRQLLRKH